MHEFSSTISWGYDPSFYFAIDGHYGGSAALARFVNAAHQSGRAVMLDVVYNHSLGSPLMEIAPDVYRNGNYDGDRMNCGHPMVGEFLRQATVHVWRTFGVDGFRWDAVAHMPYKQDGSAPFKDISRQVLFHEASLGCELRYFEMDAAGYSTLERHEHAHASDAVALLRSRHRRPRHRASEPRNELPALH